MIASCSIQAWYSVKYNEPNKYENKPRSNNQSIECLPERKGAGGRPVTKRRQSNACISAFGSPIYKGGNADGRR